MNGEMDRENGARIDAALRAVGTASPEPGLEGRILTRLAAARVEGDAGANAGRKWRMMRAAAPAVGFVTACLMCTVIVVSSVRFSHHNHPGPLAGPPVIQPSGNGVGAASAVHPAGPAQAPMPAGTAGRSSRRTSQGRARITPQARKAPGVAVPAPSASAPRN
jgi:hypothetical protein